MFLFHSFFFFILHKKSVPKNYLPSYNIIVYLKKNTKNNNGEWIETGRIKRKKRKRHRRLSQNEFKKKEDM
jgi:cell division protein FtsX